jgi:hypothetical protein
MRRMQDVDITPAKSKVAAHAPYVSFALPHLVSGYPCDPHCSVVPWHILPPRICSTVRDHFDCRRFTVYLLDCLPEDLISPPMVAILRVSKSAAMAGLSFKANLSAAGLLRTSPRASSPRTHPGSFSSTVRLNTVSLADSGYGVLRTLLAVGLACRCCPSVVHVMPLVSKLHLSSSPCSLMGARPVDRRLHRAGRPQHRRLRRPLIRLALRFSSSPRPRHVPMTLLGGTELHVRPLRHP